MNYLYRDQLQLKKEKLITWLGLKWEDKDIINLLLTNMITVVWLLEWMNPNERQNTNWYNLVSEYELTDKIITEISKNSDMVNTILRESKLLKAIPSKNKSFTTKDLKDLYNLEMIK